MPVSRRHLGRCDEARSDSRPGGMQYRRRFGRSRLGWRGRGYPQSRGRLRLQQVESPCAGIDGPQCCAQLLLQAAQDGHLCTVRLVESDLLG